MNMGGEQGKGIDGWRIVHLGKYYPPAVGGIETHTRLLARGLAERGARVCVVVVHHADAAGHDVTYNPLRRTPAVEQYDGPVRVIRLGRWGQVARFDLCTSVIPVLRQLQQQFRPHVWHLHTPNVTMLTALSLVSGVRPLVVTHHSDIIRQRFLKYLLQPWERSVYRRAAWILASSHGYCQGSPLLQRFRSRVAVIPFGIDLTPFAAPSIAAMQYRDRLRSQFGGPLWLGVGRLVSYKGWEVALQALRQVPGHLLVIGTGPLESHLRQQAVQLGVVERVHFHGYASFDELIGAYHAATALWLPSLNRAEAFGMVQLEAMACGCPIINTAIPGSGVPEVARDGDEALTVPPGDPAALADAACKLLKDKVLREKLSRQARERAFAEFDHRRMVERVEMTYRRVIWRGAST